jgi:hypothetical protein
VSELRIVDASSDPHSIKTEAIRTGKSYTVNVKDVTDQFAKAASGQYASQIQQKSGYAELNINTGLGTSQLIKDEWFTLFESVGALEV